MLRLELRHDVVKNLTFMEYFDRDDFEVSFAGKENISIEYRPNRRYFFRGGKKTVSKRSGPLAMAMLQNYQDVEVFQAKCNPGNVEQAETLDFDNIESLVHGVQEWIQRLHGEFLTMRRVGRRTAARSGDEFRIEDVFSDQDDRAAADFESVPDEPISEAEAAKARERLDELEAAFEEYLAESISDQEQLDERLERLHKEVESLKRQLDVATKKGWTESAARKMNKVLKPPPKATTTAFKAWLVFISGLFWLNPETHGVAISTSTIVGLLEDASETKDNSPRE